MNVWIKLGLPLLLGAIAAGINWVVLDSELKPYEFVRVSQDIKPGDVFKKDRLERFTLRSSEGAGSLEATVVKWSERAMLINVPCVRELHKGDLVLWRDAPAARKEVTLKTNERALQINLEHVKYEPSLLLVGNQIGFVIDRDADRPAPSTSSPGTLVLNKPRTYVVEGPFRIVSVGRRVSAQAEGDPGDLAAAKVVTIAVKTIPGEVNEALDDQANRVIQARRNNSIESIVLYPAKD
jgi:hypothetical protein